ncbi:MAG: endonuclease domain-containing protein [Bacteroidales bacterium]|nr:endonuclease domain-containing protein [Bacteroidales bacterium]
MVYLRRTRDFLLHLEADYETLRFAKKLRSSMTEAEKILWDEIRNRKLNKLKFRRQHPVHFYIADFYCHEKRLVIEVDGLVHKQRLVKEHDDTRTAELDRLGIHVIRFTNEQIQTSLQNVLNEIKTITNKLPTISPSP